MDRSKAEDVMIKRVYTIQSDRKIALARLRMLRQGVGVLPVVESERKLVGIITLRDTDFARGYDLMVKDLMTTDVVTGTEDLSVIEIAEMMIREGIERLPILGKQGILVGLVTQTVIIKGLLDLLNANAHK